MSNRPDETFGHVQVNEFVGTMSVRPRTQQSRHAKLGLWELASKHAHEGNRTALTDSHHRLSVKERGSGSLHGTRQLGVQSWCFPTWSRVRRERNSRAIR